MANFGWSWDYLHYEIAWATVQKMLLDAPHYDTDGDNKTIQLTEENAEEVLKRFEKMSS